MTQKHARTGFLACAVLAVFYSFPATAEDAKKTPKISEQTFGSWNQRCLSQEDGKQCILHQKAVDDDKNVTLIAEIGTQGNTAGPPLKILVPLGVILLIPLRVTIDDKDPADLPYTRCIPEGCMTDVLLTVDAMEKMKAGKKMTFTYTLPNQQTISSTLSLNGLTAALKAMPSQK